MAIGDLGALMSDMEVLFTTGTAAGLTDVQLLERFLSGGAAAGEAAFTALVKRHGPMVLRVCRGELNDDHAAEDAFQATFLILARQARTIRDRASLASWLFGVARRVARRARRDRARRAARERRRASMIEDQARHAPEPPELLPEIQEEVDRLPERYRAPIVLCDLEGRTHEEAAGQLRIPVGTVKTRLSRGRERLRGRLIRRGLAPALVASALAAPARAAIAKPLLETTVRAAMQVAAFRAAGVSATVASLVQGVLRAMFLNKLRTAALFTAASMALLVAVATLSTPVRSESGPERPAPPAAPKPAVAPPQVAEPVEVPVAIAKKSVYRPTANQPGTVEPSQRVDVLPTASGPLTRLAVDLGSLVKKGDVLAEIWSPELELDLARARASVEQARARIMTARSRFQVSEAAVKTALATVASSEAALKAAEAQVSYRKKQVERIRQLFERGAVEHRLLGEEEDRSRAAEDEAFSAKVQVTFAKAGVEEARAKLEATKADMGEFEAGLHLAEIERQKAERNLEGTRIVAPIDGVVTRRMANVGEFVRAAALGSTQPLLTIMQTKSVRVITQVPDRQVPLVDVGDPATFRPNAFFGRQYQGKVSRMAGMEDPDRTLRVEIDLDNADGRLRPGMFGAVEIQLEPPREAASIPNAAVDQSRDGSSFCYRVVDGRAVRTPIVYRANDGEQTVVEGLADGSVVVSQVRSVQDGQRIKPVLGGSTRPAAPKAATKH